MAQPPRRWKHFNIKSTGTCTVSCHLLQSETNVSRVTTAWARKLIQLNTRTVWRDNRGKGNPNYQRERTAFPLGNQDLQWKRRARVRLPGTDYSQLVSKPWTVTKAVHWELQPVLRVVKDTLGWDMYRYLHMSAPPGSWLTWWLGVKAALETCVLANDWLNWLRVGDSTHKSPTPTPFSPDNLACSLPPKQNQLSCLHSSVHATASTWNVLHLDKPYPSFATHLNLSPSLCCVFEPA